MSYKIIPTPEFEKSVKLLAKSYRQIGDDLLQFETDIQNGTVQQVELGKGCFKARIANSSIPTGKSGGFRIIYYKKIENKIYLLEIYSKTELENISDERILEILKNNGL